MELVELNTREEGTVGMGLSSAAGSRTECRPLRVCAEATCTRKEPPGRSRQTPGSSCGAGTVHVPQARVERPPSSRASVGSPDASLRNGAKFAAHERTDDGWYSTENYRTRKEAGT